MLLLSLLSLLGILAGTSAESVDEEETDQYFGVPLGALHSSSDGTSAEIYAADEFTVIFNHFHHNPRVFGCTAMMIGPPRADDHENVIDGHGVLIAPAHPPVRAAVSRIRRQVDTDPFLLSHHEQHPIEFGHLLHSAQLDKPHEADDAASPSSNRSISILKKSSPERRVAHVESSGGSVGPTNVEYASVATRSRLITVDGGVGESGEAVRELVIGNATIATMAPPSRSVASQGASATTTATKAVSTPPEGSQAPLILFTPSPNPQAASDHLLRRQFRVRDSPPQVESSAQSFPTSPEDKAPQPSTAAEAKKQILIKGDSIRRAPSRLEFEPLNENQKTVTTTQRPRQRITTAAVSANSNTPLFWIIKDPREQRRQRLVELRRRIFPEEFMTTTTPVPTTPTDHFDEKFRLPRVRNKLATFSLTNGAKLTHYSWIGLYDQCQRKHTPLVLLRDVDPPREERIGPLSGWSHNITSYRVHILNCNTILVPGFSFEPLNATANTYFYVGSGHLPDRIEQQVRAIVVGNKEYEPLKAYNSEDVLLRLPKGYRTFDIDFIMVYNTDEQRSYGHVLIPSLLVPPCTDD